MMDPTNLEIQQPWVQTVRNAADRPEMFIGCRLTGHLRLLEQLLTFIYGAGGIQGAGQTEVHLSAFDVLVVLREGLLKPAIDDLIPWSSHDVLLRELHIARERLLPPTRPLDDSEDWDCFASPTSIAGMLYLARSGSIVLRSRTGVWMQSYSSGWPTTPPTRVDGVQVALVLAANLDQRWFSGAPYTAAQAEKLAREWHEQALVTWHESVPLEPARTTDLAEGLSWVRAIALEPGE